jgi:hypothetical protein
VRSPCGAISVLVRGDQSVAPIGEGVAVEIGRVGKAFRRMCGARIDLLDVVAVEFARPSAEFTLLVREIRWLPGRVFVVAWAIAALPSRPRAASSSTFGRCDRKLRMRRDMVSSSRVNSGCGVCGVPLSSTMPGLNCVVISYFYFCG